MAKRIAIIDRDSCTKQECGYMCMKACPVNRMKEACIVINEEDGYPNIDEEKCIGCGICVKKCPWDAIKIINLSKDLGTPMFSYGKNMFSLYGLPIPKKGEVIGLIGKNGIGKTTAIRLLSKQLKPNLGQEKDLSWDEIYKNTSNEVRNYMESLGPQQKISIKPQDIERIRENDITVSKLLKTMKINEEMLQRFELEKIKDRKLAELSGGELQKLSMAIAIGKQADIYYIDEMTNYLDIRDRLKVSVMLKEFGEKNTLIVVDHDLTVIDYLVGYVYIVFGDEGAYGAMSTLKAARTGINEYLEGFLRAENLKIRDFEIKYPKFSQGEERAHVFFKYPGIEKDYGNFKLKVEPGEVREKEVIGIVGGNALGKTTFMKMIAGVEAPDNVELEHRFKIAYKKQYLEPSSETVESVFSKGDQYIIERAKSILSLPNNIMNEPLNELSGGQLQKVSITHVLSLDADIYLLDEPSAFLDVEQRIAFSHLVADFTEYRKKPVFIIDHDISLIDRVANRIILFSGEKSVNGHGSAILHKKDGMNTFLKEMDITIRRDIDTYRPRINKPGSVLDREQREKGEYYYTTS